MKRFLLRALAALVVLAVVGAVLFFELVDHFPLAAAPRPRLAVPAALDARLRCDPAFPLAVTLDAEIAMEGHRVLPGRISIRRTESPAPFETKFQLWLADGAKAPAPVLV